MIRTFIAVEVSTEVRERAVELIENLQASRAKISWTKPHNMHLTLKFLGDTPEERLAEVAQAVVSAAVETPAFALRLQGVGVFPMRGARKRFGLALTTGERRSVGWPQPSMNALYRRRFPKEKRHFEAHLTIGRVRGATPGERQELGRLLADQHDFDCGLTNVREVLVMSSQLSPAGPTYAVLQRCPLRLPDQS